MALWKDVLCKKEEKIAPPSWGPATARFWCQLLPRRSQPTLKHEAPSRDTNGFSIKYQALRGGKTGAGRVLVRTRELIVGSRWGSSTAALDLPEVVFSGDLWSCLVSSNQNPPLPGPPCQKMH